MTTGAGAASCGPYHGVEPGIFKSHAQDRGWLGKKDQALVIADVDPIYAAEGRPRPQLLPSPLRLVAHLPIIESWQPKSNANDSLNGCWCSRHTRTDALKFAPKLFAALFGKKASQFKHSAEDCAPQVLKTALDELAISCDKNRWLEKRAKAYLENHASDPQAWPPPAAVDWLYVDLDSIEPGSYPKIELPPFCKAFEPADTAQRARVSPQQRDARESTATEGGLKS